MLTRLCLIRHGETDWNAERRLQGQIDIPLNALGVLQAKAAAESLYQDLLLNAFAAIYSSDLKRAHETATIIAHRLDLSVTADSSLRERDYGDLQGLTIDDAELRYPEYRPRNRAPRNPELVLPNGDSLQNFANTVRAGLTAIALRHPGQSVLVVSHGGVLDIAYRMATAMPLSAARDFPIANATLNWIGFDAENRQKSDKTLESYGTRATDDATEDGAWQLLEWDQRAHLDISRDELPL